MLSGVSSAPSPWARISLAPWEKARRAAFVHLDMCLAVAHHGAVRRHHRAQRQAIGRRAGRHPQPRAGCAEQRRKGFVQRAAQRIGIIGKIGRIGRLHRGPDAGVDGSGVVGEEMHGNRHDREGVVRSSHPFRQWHAKRPGLSETVSITHDDQGSHGAYHATVAGEAAEGLLTWREASPGVVVADHTLVPTAIGGRGVAARLVEALIADARAAGVEDRAGVQLCRRTIPSPSRVGRLAGLTLFTSSR
jgi:predicted GNAT family acetyltransferase